MMKMESDKDKKLELLNHSLQYKDRLGYFGMPLAVESSSTMDPGKNDDPRLMCHGLLMVILD